MADNTGSIKETLLQYFPKMIILGYLSLMLRMEIEVLNDNQMSQCFNKLNFGIQILTGKKLEGIVLQNLNVRDHAIVLLFKVLKSWESDQTGTDSPVPFLKGALAISSL